MTIMTSIFDLYLNNARILFMNIWRLLSIGFITVCLSTNSQGQYALTPTDQPIRSDNPLTAEIQAQSDRHYQAQLSQLLSQKQQQLTFF
jgi:hypothetical protein